MTQTIKLGLPGLETTLFGESRSFVTSGNQLNSIDSQSAGGTIDVNFIANKRTFTINYGVLSEAEKNIITGIYLLQGSTPSFLSFIYTDESGSDVQATVKMSAPQFGAINPKDTFYYNGSEIELEEV